MKTLTWKRRFRGFLPVIVDVETSGLNPQTDAILEIATVTLQMNNEGMISRDKTYAYHVDAFEGARFDPESLKLNRIIPDHPFRFAIPLQDALQKTFSIVDAAVKAADCQRAVLVGHNAWFDLSFLTASCERCDMKKMPFHKFTSLDTASMGALVYGQTVLARVLNAAHIPFDQNEAHSAIYDAEKTADVFCKMVNKVGLEN